MRVGISVPSPEILHCPVSDVSTCPFYASMLDPLISTRHDAPRGPSVHRIRDRTADMVAMDDGARDPIRYDDAVLYIVYERSCDSTNDLSTYLAAGLA